MIPLRTLLPSLLALAAPIVAQTPLAIELDDGEVVVGTVVDVTDEVVRVGVEFPKPETRELDRDRIQVRSLFAILASRVDPNSAEELRQLSETAAEMGLQQHAIAALRAAARADEEGRTGYNQDIESHRESIAEAILITAREDLKLGNYASARLGARFIEESFGKTEANDGAKQLLEELDGLQENVPDAEFVSEDEATEILEDTEKRMRRAQEGKLFSSVNTVSLDAKHRERLEKAVKYLQAVWKPLSEALPEREASEKLRDHYVATRDKVRDQLLRHYLALGRIHLQVGAIPEATKLNEKACALDADHEGCAQLQRMIVFARLEGGALR